MKQLFNNIETVYELFFFDFRKSKCWGNVIQLKIEKPYAVTFSEIHRCSI